MVPDDPTICPTILIARGAGVFLARHDAEVEDGTLMPESSVRLVHLRRARRADDMSGVVDVHGIGAAAAKVAE